MLEERKEEIKRFVEIECKDWYELKVLNIEQINKKTLLTLVDTDNYKYRVEIGVLRRSRSRNLQLQVCAESPSFRCGMNSTTMCIK